MSAAIASVALTSSMDAHAQFAAGGGTLGPANKADGIAIGIGVYANDGFALNSNGGSGTDPLAVHYDDSSMARVTLGGAGSSTPVTISNVAPGRDGNDAVNFEQLQAAVTNVSSTTQQALPQESSNTKNALQAMSNRLGAVNESVDAAQSVGAVQSVGSTHGSDPYVQVDGDGDSTSYAYAGPNSQAIAIGRTATATVGGGIAIGNASTATGTGNAPVTLTNVANGALNVASSDAVNGAQLYAAGLRTDTSGNVTNAFVAYDDTSMNSVTFGGSGHAPVQLHNVASGTANYQGYQAVALGASARITQNIKVKVGGGYASGGGATVGGGMAYQW